MSKKLKSLNQVQNLSFIHSIDKRIDKFIMSSEVAEPMQEEIQKAFEEEITTKNGEEEEYEDLSNDGGVLKKIIKEGDGFEKPQDGTEVTVSYVGRLKDNGKEFDRSDEFKFTVGKNQVIKGWDMTLRTMRLNESCKVILKPEYAYGSTGAGESIPPNSTLEFDIELKKFSNLKDITKDGGIMKKIILSSDEWKTPKFESEVEFKIIGRTMDGKTFMDETKKIVIGDEEVIKGIEKCLKTMKKGERSIFEVKPEYGYGEEGYKDLVKPNETVSFEIELIDFKHEEPYDIDDIEEKIKKSEERKIKGNNLFKEGKYKRAVKTYKRAIKFVEYLHDATEDQKKKADEMKVTCQLNQTQCYIKMKEFKKAKELVNKVLEKNGSNIKALYRRGVILSELGEWKESMRDFEKCLEIDCNNVDVKREMEKLRRKIKAQDEKDRSIYSKMFKKL